jgi:DNA-binding transcriptional regulator YdaS (Cro superfamily)
MYTIHQASLLKACRSVGSQAELARRIGVSRAQVNHWLNRGDKISYEYLIAIETATNGQVSRHDLAPACLVSDDQNSVPPLYYTHLKNIHECLSRLENETFKKMELIEEQLGLLTKFASFDSLCAIKELGK